MSDSVGHHRRQPTRLPCPLDSPGKNTGVGCHFLLQCRKVKSESKVTQSCPTLSDPMDCSLPGSSIHGIFQARVLEWGAKLLRMPYMVLGDKTKCSRIQVTKDSEFLLVLGCVHCIGQWFSGQAVNWLQRPCHRQNQKTGLIKVYEKCVKNCYFICYC